MPEQNIDEKIKNLQIDTHKKVMPIRRKSSKKLWIWGIIILLIIIFFSRSMFIPPEIEIAKVIKMDQPKVGDTLLTVSGYVVPNHQIELSPKIIGRVKWIGVDKGDKVKKGQEIVTIENTDYQAQVDQAKGRLAAAKARLLELQTGSRVEEVRMALASVHQAESQSNNSKMNFQRIAKLYIEGAVSKESYDNASTQYVIAKSQLDSANQQYDITKIGPRKEQIQAAQADVNSSQASLRFTESQLSDTIIRAPSDGTILERLIEVGEMVTNASYGGTRGARTALLSMADMNDIQVEIDINEADIHKVHLTQPASVSLEAYPDDSYKGKLVEIAPEANRQKATVQVKVQILNPNDKVKPEMNAKVSFLNDISPEQTDNKTRIYIPARAIVTNQEDSFVFVIDNNTVKKVKIKKGKDSEFGIEVEEGLSGNETIAASGLDLLKDGSRIRVKKS